ncbi:MAG TPA: AIR synthase related protein, partial [Chloroflexia bacterium]|nr:AIR synthase related protein [Chloroflexia bacterium]
GTNKGIALTVDCNGRYCYLDAYAGGAHAVAEAARNLSCVGAEPLAVTDCLNFGNPERPHVFYQMESAVAGIADACNALNLPVVSGNVSLYNEANGVPVMPTPVVGMIGLLEDVERRASMALREGLVIGLLTGVADEERRTKDESSLGASEYVEACLGLKAGRPVALDFDAERAVQAACRQAIREGLVDVAHDCSDGGLAVALAEMCIAGGVGAAVSLDELASGIHPATNTRHNTRADVLLFGEEPSRIIIALSHDAVEQVEGIAASFGARLVQLGEVQDEHMTFSRGGAAVASLAVARLSRAWSESLG